MYTGEYTLSSPVSEGALHVVPFSFPEPGVLEDLLQWRLASKERINVRAEADVEDPGRVAALHYCLYLPFLLSLSLALS